MSVLIIVVEEGGWVVVDIWLLFGLEDVVVYVVYGGFGLIVFIVVCGVFGGVVDFVFFGVNYGVNVGCVILYLGIVGVVLMGGFNGVCGMVVLFDVGMYFEVFEWDVVVEVVICLLLVFWELVEGMVINVNVFNVVVV